jgi:hypothetical protein
VRDPDRYTPTDHFRERLSHPGRYVTVGAFRRAVRAGGVRYNTREGWRFVVVEDGVRYVFPVDGVRTPRPTIITGYTEVADRPTADAADRWSTVDLDTIELRTLLSDRRDEHVPGEIRPRHVPDPVAVAGHAVVSPCGRPAVVCERCGTRATSKAGLADRPCRRQRGSRRRSR